MRGEGGDDETPTRNLGIVALRALFLVYGGGGGGRSQPCGLDVRASHAADDDSAKRERRRERGRLSFEIFRVGPFLLCGLRYGRVSRGIRSDDTVPDLPSKARESERIYIW